MATASSGGAFGTRVIELPNSRTLPAEPREMGAPVSSRNRFPSFWMTGAPCPGARRSASAPGRRQCAELMTKLAAVACPETTVTVAGTVGVVPKAFTALGALKVSV